MVIRFILFLCIFTLPLVGCAYGPQNTSGRVVLEDDRGMVDIAFSNRDREIIRDYYAHSSKKKNMPPGLAKKGQLPPGLQKQLRKRGQLPPGLEYRSLPYDLERRLSRLPDGYARVMIEGRVVLFNQRTNVIFDVIHDI